MGPVTYTYNNLFSHQIHFELWPSDSKTDRGHLLANVPWRAMVNSHCVDKAFMGNDFTP